MIVRPLVVAALLAIGATMFSTSAGASTPLLPGETVTSQGVPSYVFGTNDGPNYSSPNFDTPTIEPQADVKAAGLTFLRIWSYSGDTKATVLAKVAAVQNTGETCLMVLGTTGSLAWLEKTMNWVEPTCHIFEFGNEPDNGGTISSYTSHWVKFIPTLRALHPDAVFGGPVLTWSGAKDGTAGSYPTDIAYFLHRTAAVNVRADFISYHNYSCSNESSKASCLADTAGDIQWNWNNVIPYEVKYYGAQIPTGVSEYNFDPGTSNLYNWASDGSFMTSYTTAAIDEFATLGMAFANEYTTLNYAGYGNLDMFDDSTFQPKPQFNAMADEVAKYR